MTSRSLLALLCLPLLAASCDEISGRDAPDLEGTGSVSGSGSGSGNNGSCSGLPMKCSDRSVALCSEGCVVATTCAANAVSTCVALATQSACVAVAECRWSAFSYCYASGTFCNLYTSQSSCQQAALCAWGQGCTGDTTANCNATTQAACVAVRGCTWRTF